MRPDRSGRWTAFIGWLFALGVLRLAWRGAHKHPGFTVTDIGAWGHDWQGLLGCVADKEHVGACIGSVSKFPLAYLANSALFGSTVDSGERLLTIANGLALTLPLLAVALSQGLDALKRAGWPYVLAIALSPLPMFYVASGALEVQAGVFCGIYIGACAQRLASPNLDAGRRNAWIIAFSGFIFPLYKDTAALLVGLAGLVTLACHVHMLREQASTPEGRIRLRQVALLAAGPVILAQFANLTYCWVKYGVPLPVSYIDEAAQTGPSLTKSAEFLAGSLLSPNGGVLVFWALPMCVAIVGWRAAGLIPRRSVVILGSATALVFWLALARWWTPFGWEGWGNRLMIPAVLAVLASLPFCMRARQPATEVVVSWPVSLACLPLAIYSLYYVMLPYTQSQVRSLHDSLLSSPACISMRERMASAQGSSFWRTDVYYSCARERMLYVPRPHIRTH
jgi:hypothetical protein